MSGLDALKQDHYPLWLCLSFEKPERRALWADMLLFAFTLDRAIAVTKEPLLRQIRLQWWVEMFETGAAKGVPLAEHLLEHAAHHDLPVETLMQHWFNACDKDQPEALNDCLDGWVYMLGWLAGGQGKSCDDIARNIGRIANHLEIKPLEKPKDYKSLSGFFQAAFWLIKRQQESPSTADDKRLAFYLFRKILFG